MAGLRAVHTRPPSPSALSAAVASERATLPTPIMCKGRGELRKKGERRGGRGRRNCCCCCCRHLQQRQPLREPGVQSFDSSWEGAFLSLLLARPPPPGCIADLLSVVGRRKERHLCVGERGGRGTVERGLTTTTAASFSPFSLLGSEVGGDAVALSGPQTPEEAA